MVVLKHKVKDMQIVSEDGAFYLVEAGKKSPKTTSFVAKAKSSKAWEEAAAPTPSPKPAPAPTVEEKAPVPAPASTSGSQMAKPVKRRRR